MGDSNDIDYGPLTELIGVWVGDKGLDVAPEPDGAENNPYYETITFTAAGDVTNAESQVLAAVHYRQIVESLFMQQYARTTKFHHRITVGKGILSHSETTRV